METFSRRELFKRIAKTAGVVAVSYTPVLNVAERAVYATSYRKWGPFHHAMAWLLENFLGR